MACSEEEMKYNYVTEILFNTFGAVLHRDTIYSIVESCCGDLNHAANAIMSITSEENSETPIDSTTYNDASVQNSETPIDSTTYNDASLQNSVQAATKNRNKSNDTTSGIETNSMSMDAQLAIQSMPKMSYAGASVSKNKEQIPKKIEKPYQGFRKDDFQNNSNVWSEQLRRIVTYHNQGTRTLIIMRGAPGSGKTYLARQIQEITVGAVPQQLHIFSTDEYFMVKGRYKFDKMNLPRAHLWNQHRASEALDKGISPVIIDNTNIEYWEIYPYAKTGVYNGYLIEVVEPKTFWARNAHQLTIRNVHGVPTRTIKKFLEMMSVPITSASLITNFKLVYPNGMEPPVLRNLPKIMHCSNDNYMTVKTMSPSQENDVETETVIENNKGFSLTTQNNVSSNSKMEIVEAESSVHSNKQMMHIIAEEVGCNNVRLDMEKPEFNYCESIDQLTDLTLETKPKKEILNDKVETLSISEDRNTIMKCVPLESDNGENYDNLKENDCHIIKNIQPSDPTQYTDDKITLKEKSPSHTSNCTEIKGEQINYVELLEEFEKVENEWENGEAWEEDISKNKQEPIVIQINKSLEAKLPRNKRVKENEKCLQNLHEENDWRKIYVPMTSFTDNNNLLPTPSKTMVETKSTETCIEVGDTDTSGIKNGSKIISAIARDINLNYLANLPERIPENRKFDKSSMTNEYTVMSGPHRCKNEDKHFMRFRNMFKHLRKEELRYIFDNCCGDVNWAVSIVMDDMINNQFESVTLDEQSEIEEDYDEPCGCNSVYGIIPDVTATNIQNDHISDAPTIISTDTSNPIKKQKKDSPVSDSSLALKRQIEQNIVISDQHYSEECLKVRKMRRGRLDGDVSSSQNIATGITMQNTNQLDAFSMFNIDNCNTDADTQEATAANVFETIDSEQASDDESTLNEVEKTVNVNLGYEFLSQLDTLFGRTDMYYSENIEPRINMPMSMLNEINALWMESLMSQLEAESKSHEAMIKQDEEFARLLSLEELEASRSGREPEVPNFKEIMDMEMAISLYRKDCEEWMQKDRPTDIATKLSSKKLYDLFPEIPPDDLDEILMAHHYDFRTTVGVLLETQGRTDITEEENGVNKFIMAQELERQEKFLAAEKKRLMEQRWPELPNKINMDTVNDYRSKAKSHLAHWNKNFGKAKHMVKKNTAVANYYKSLAGLHLLKYEQANSVAAVSLLQIHAKNSENDATLDLHFLHVEEAKAALDIFLDSHIQRIRLKYSRDRKPTALFIITGRGLHSRGGPKIKPAVKGQLRRRGLNYKELNPGLLSVKIGFEDQLSFEVP